jgi:hypothetical protein
MKTSQFLFTALLLPQATTATSLGGAALSAMKSIDYRYFVAGGTCAAISHGITTPIDVVKTNIGMDVEDSLTPGATLPFLNECYGCQLTTWIMVLTHSFHSSIYHYCVGSLHIWKTGFL